MLLKLPVELRGLIRKFLSNETLIILAKISKQIRKEVGIHLMGRYSRLVSAKTPPSIKYLFLLARVGFTDLLKAYIESHPKLKINYKIYFSREHNAFYSPIHFAAWGGVLSTVKLLEKFGAIYQPERATRCYLSPLHYAADSGNPKCVTHFLDAGVPVDQQSTVCCPLGWNWTALQIASNAGATACMLVLLQRGANVSFQDPDEYQAIHRAADSGSGAAIELLLAHNADPNAVNEDGVTPMANAVCGDNRASVIGALLQGKANARVAMNFPNFNMPLQGCILQEDLKAAKVLLDFDPTLVNAQYLSGGRMVRIGMASWTALHVAAYKKYEAGIIFLLAHGADVSIRNSDGNLAIDMVSDKDSPIYILLSEAQEHERQVMRPGNIPITQIEQENIPTSSCCRIC
jgi:ankyrin repeat protein